MIVRYPEYYRKFRCIAGDCPDTCCAGWEIVVDKTSEQRYRKIAAGSPRDPFSKKLKQYIRDGRILSDAETCPFLDRDGLCEMYRELGPESLCETCKRHPRHLEDYGNLQEMVLLLSCPEAARLVLEELPDRYYLREFPYRPGDMEGIDEERLETLLQVREAIRKIGHDRSISMERRMALCLALAHDVQRRLRTGADEDVPAVTERYGREDAPVRFFRQWKEACGVWTPVWSCMRNCLEELDTIYSGWPGMLEDLKNAVEAGPKTLASAEAEAVRQKDMEHVFAYYIYSYVLASLYDGDLLTKVKMAAVCTMLTGILYSEDKAEISGSAECSAEERVRICHGIARQMENSDENRNRLEMILKQERFSAGNLINALLEGEKIPVQGEKR